MPPFTIILSGLKDKEWAKIAEHEIDPLVQEMEMSFSVTFKSSEQY